MGKRTWILRVTASAGVCLLLLAGCTTPNRNSGTEDRDRYIDFCRELATSPVPEREDPDDFMSKPDWMVHPCSTTDQEFKKEYVVMKIGKDALQGDVRPHDNFYLSKDGWHFVFNAYEVACYAVGDVEVVIPK